MYTAGVSISFQMWTLTIYITAAFQGKVNHCRIRTKQERGQTKYYLIDSVCFDTLYSLVTHYQTHPLRSQEFYMYLTEPVPQPNR